MVPAHFASAGEAATLNLRKTAIGFELAVAAQPAQQLDLRLLGPASYDCVQQQDIWIASVTFVLPCMLSVEFRLHFVAKAGTWAVRTGWRLDRIDLPLSPPVPLDDWLGLSAPSRPTRARLTSPALQQIGRALGRPYGPSGDVVPDQAWVELDRAFSIRLGFTRPATLSGYRLRSLGLAPRPRGAPPDWCAGASIAAGQIELARPGGAVRVAWPAGTQLALVTADATATLSGHLQILVGPDIDLPCTTLATRRTGTALHAEPTTGEGHARIRRLHVTLGPATAPGVIEGLGGALKMFELKLPLAEVAIVMPDADVARLSFDAGRPVRLGLTGKPAPDIDDLTLEPHGGIRLGLRHARLRVRRGADLLDLGFRFRGFALQDTTPPSLVRSGEADPILLVDFPPQHVMQRSFLRQDVGLPDVGRAVTAAELRALARPGPDATKLRQLIYDEKTKLDDPDRQAFRDFAGRWHKTHTVLWIGPAGLLTIEDRQAARALAITIVHEKRQDLATRLKAAGPSPANALILEGIKLAPLPRPTIDPTVALAFAKQGWPALHQHLRRLEPDYAAITKDDDGPLWLSGADGWPITAEQAQRFGLDRAATRDNLAIARFILAVIDLRQQQESDVISTPVEARLAGDTRLAFTLKHDRILLSVAQLTTWDSKFVLDQRVTQRAARLDFGSANQTDLRTYLHRLGIEPGGNIKDRLTQLHGSLVAPTSKQSSIELPARLFLSPAADLCWDTPPSPPRGRMQNPVWSATLQRENRSLRAVWAEEFRRDDFSDQPPQPGNPVPPVPFRTALDGDDRHELVVLSSVHGLPVVGLDPGAETSARRESSFTRPPPGYEPTDVDKTDEVSSSAIYIPKPIGYQHLSLGALGATLRASTGFEPPAAVMRKGLHVFPTLSVERWDTQIVDGMDVVTTIMRRGYLFPCGHVASLVTQTSPRLRWTAAGYIWEQATRFFVMIGRERQAFPAVGQSMAGRATAMQSITLRTSRTPDLVDPRESDPRPADALIGTDLHGRVSGKTPQGDTIKGLVFWPRTKLGADGTFAFRLSVNDRDAAVRMPLLFLDNAAANDEPTLRALCAWYAEPGDKPPDWNLMRHGETELAYAPEAKQGDCTLATNWQRWSAAGRENGARPFLFDGPLQAVEQPPFYPVMLQAEVTSRQVQGLTGSAAAPFLIQMRKRYLDHGFEPGPDNETFLDVISDGLHPMPVLGMGANGDRGGGVARPAMVIRGWNRSLGPVGGADPPSPPPGAVTKDLMLASPPGLLDSLSDTKMLGLISVREFVSSVLEDVASACPVLQEITEYEHQAKAKADTALKPVRDELDKVLFALAEVFDPGCAARKDCKAGLARARDALPDLTAALEAMQFALAGVVPDDELAAATWMAKVWSAGQALLGAVQRTLAAPTGAAAAVARGVLTGLAGIDSLETAWVSVRQAVAQWLAENAGRASLAPLLLRLPPVDPSLADAADAALRTAASDPQVWLGADPADAILQRMRADPQLRTALQDAAKDQVVGPLWAWFQPVIALATASVSQGLNGLVTALTDVRTRVDVAIATLRTFASQAAALCDHALPDLSAFLDAALPNLGASSGIVLMSRPGRSVLDIINSAAKGLEDDAQELDQIPLPDHAAILRACAQRLAAARGDIAAKLDAYAAARSVLLQKVPRACDGMADVRLWSLLGHVQSMRLALDQGLLAAALPRDAAASPIPPPPRDPSGSRAWASAASRLAGIGQALLRLPLAQSLLGPDGQASRSTLASGLSTAPPSTPSGLAAELDQLSQQATAVVAQADALARAAKADVGQVLTAMAVIRQAVADVIAAWHDGRLRAALLDAVLKSALGDSAREVAQDLQEVLGLAIKPVYAAISGVRKAAYEAAKPKDGLATRLFGPPPTATGWCSGSWSDAVFLVPYGGACSVDADALTHEQSLSAPDLAQLWRANQAAPQILVLHAEKIAVFASYALVSNLVPLDELRGLLDDLIAKLVPIQKRLVSTLKVPLKPLDLFGIITFTPEADPNPNPDLNQKLSLSSEIVAKFNPSSGQSSVTTHFLGRIAPFTLGITGVFDVIFKSGVTYEAGSGAAGKLTAHVGPDDVTFGPVLSFLEGLASAFTMGDPNQGPYSRILIDRPALEAGYTLAIPVIVLGATFSNINLLASLVLPFDAQEARLRLSLGSLALPFTVSVGVYGGAGFFACEASARGIELFEASFQFGAVVSLGYGPLHGIGYVLTGAYIRKDANGCAFSLLFVAGFSAHIACFALSASFTLRLGTPSPSDGGGLEGEATLVYSFKVGFAGYSFNVRVHRKLGAGFKDGGAGAQDSAMLEQRTMLADATGVIPRGPELSLQSAKLITVTPPPIEQWRAYIAQFDHNFRPVEQEL